MLYRYRPSNAAPNKNVLSDRRLRILTFLKNNPIGVLSTVTPNNDPHGTVIYYSVNEQFVASFLTRHDTRKYDNIRHHKHVMLTVFDPRSQTTAQITGRATEVTKRAEVNRIAANTLGASLVTSEGGTPPITKLEVGEYAAFTIEPVQIRLAVFGRPDPGDYSEIFESIESYELND
jgi:uncharacterized pyridoxamine 5'-phosphate oxidase family protein